MKIPALIKRFVPPYKGQMALNILFNLLSTVLSLLSHGDVQLDAIADLTGWKSPAALRQYFKRKMGVSMREHRKRQSGASSNMP